MGRKIEKLHPVALELKADAESNTIEGYGSVFGNTDLGGDVVEKGAFAESLASGRKIKMLWNHSADWPVGVWDEAREDDTGLFLRGHLLTDTTMGRDVMGYIKGGAVDGLSIGFRMERDGFEYDKEAGVRRITKADLWEVSAVTFPMNEEARITAKSEDEIDAMSVTEMERFLREASDLSRAQVKRVIHRLQSLGEQRKAADIEDLETALNAERLLRVLRG